MINFIVGSKIFNKKYQFKVMDVFPPIMLMVTRFYLLLNYILILMLQNNKIFLFMLS